MLQNRASSDDSKSTERESVRHNAGKSKRMGGGKTGRVCSKNIHLLCAGDLWLAVEIGLRIQGRSGWTSKWQSKYWQGAKTVQQSSNKSSLTPEKDLISRRADNARTSLYTPQFSLKSDWAVKEKKKMLSWRLFLNLTDSSPFRQSEGGWQTNYATTRRQE